MGSSSEIAYLLVHCDGYVLLLLVIAPPGCQRFILKLGRQTVCMEGRLEPPSQNDALDSLSNFKIAFHQCVSSYFSLSCGAELGHVLLLLEENRRSTCFPSMFVITQLFFFFSVYLNEIDREAIACIIEITEMPPTVKLYLGYAGTCASFQSVGKFSSPCYCFLQPSPHELAQGEPSAVTHLFRTVCFSCKTLTRPRRRTTRWQRRGGPGPGPRAGAG